MNKSRSTELQEYLRSNWGCKSSSSKSNAFIGTTWWSKKWVASYFAVENCIRLLYSCLTHCWPESFQRFKGSVFLFCSPAAAWWSALLDDYMKSVVFLLVLSRKRRSFPTLLWTCCLFPCCLGRLRWNVFTCSIWSSKLWKPKQSSGGMGSRAE